MLLLLIYPADTAQIGRQMITTGKRYTPKEIERYVDSVTPEEIKRVAQKYLWDKDVSGCRLHPRGGGVEADMSSSLWLQLAEPRVCSTTTESERVG